MTSPSLAGTPRAAGALRVALLGCLLALLGVLGLAACGDDNPSSPEDLFARMCSAMNEGRTGELYDLQTLEYQQRFRDGVANNRDTAERNPGARGGLIARYQVTWEQFRTMTPMELWHSSHQGMNKVLVGARILDKTTDPVEAADVLMTIETSAGQRFRWVMRMEPGRGWRLQRAEPVKLETGRDE